jgi:hypothetical protein
MPRKQQIFGQVRVPAGHATVIFRDFSLHFNAIVRR